MYVCELICFVLKMQFKLLSSFDLKTCHSDERCSAALCNPVVSAAGWMKHCEEGLMWGSCGWLVSWRQTLEKHYRQIKLFSQAKLGAYWNGHFNQVPNRGEAETSPRLGLLKWLADDDACLCCQVEEGKQRLWEGKVLTRRSGLPILSQLALHSAWRGEISRGPDDSHSLWSKGHRAFPFSPLWIHRTSDRLRLSGLSLAAQ